MLTSTTSPLPATAASLPPIDPLSVLPPMDLFLQLPPDLFALIYCHASLRSIDRQHIELTCRNWHSRAKQIKDIQLAELQVTIEPLVLESIRAYHPQEEDLSLEEDRSVFGVKRYERMQARFNSIKGFWYNTTLPPVDLFLQLPPELLALIFLNPNLNKPDRQSIAGTCKRWFLASQEMEQQQLAQLRESLTPELQHLVDTRQYTLSFAKEVQRYWNIFDYIKLHSPESIINFGVIANLDEHALYPETLRPKETSLYNTNKGIFATQFPSNSSCSAILYLLPINKILIQLVMENFLTPKIIRHINQLPLGYAYQHLAFNYEQVHSNLKINHVIRAFTDNPRGLIALREKLITLEQAIYLADARYIYRAANYASPLRVLLRDESGLEALRRGLDPCSLGGMSEERVVETITRFNHPDSCCDKTS